MPNRSLAGSVFVALSASAACTPTPPAAPPPILQTATQAASLPRAPLAIPPRAPQQPGINAGHPAATNVRWQFPGAPPAGVDAVRVAMSPRGYESPGQNFIYWAYYGLFMDEEGYYVGLQPSGQYEKTALFSVFGAGATPMAASCKSGADGGAGTSCHIPYAWSTGDVYQFAVALVAADAESSTWQGTVQDLATGAITVIGDIRVGSSRGYLKATGVSFAEYFKRPTPCPEQPGSEVLFLEPFAYRSGVEYPGVISSMNMNSGCSPAFFGDGRTYVYVDVGH